MRPNHPCVLNNGLGFSTKYSQWTLYCSPMISYFFVSEISKWNCDHCSTEKEMSFWRNYHSLLHRKLSKWQLPVQPGTTIFSEWHFRFTAHLFLSSFNKFKIWHLYVPLFRRWVVSFTAHYGPRYYENQLHLEKRGHWMPLIPVDGVRSQHKHVECRHICGVMPRHGLLGHATPINIY